MAGWNVGGRRRRCGAIRGHACRPSDCQCWITCGGRGADGLAPRRSCLHASIPAGEGGAVGIVDQREHSHLLQPRDVRQRHQIGVAHVVADQKGMIRQTCIEGIEHFLLRAHRVGELRRVDALPRRRRAQGAVAPVGHGLQHRLQPLRRQRLQRRPAEDGVVHHAVGGMVHVVEAAHPGPHALARHGIARPQRRFRKDVVEIFEDGRAFDQHRAVVDQRRHDAARVERAIGGRVLLAGLQVDGDALVSEAFFDQRQPHLLRGSGEYAVM